MNTKNKIMTCLMLSAGGAVSLALLNKYIQFSATSRGLTREENSLCYKWRLGNIYYTKCGSGKPLLLIHDLHFASSGYEWESIREQLSRSYTVYTLDLLGCGRSEKPNLTYTNYLFVQLICDFIKSEIGHRTNILSTVIQRHCLSWRAATLQNCLIRSCSSTRAALPTVVSFRVKMPSFISFFWISRWLERSFTTLRAAAL